MALKDLEARRAYHREYQRKLRERKHDELLEYQAKWREDNREKINDRRRELYAEKVEEGSLKPRSQSSEYARQYYLKNKERVNERVKKYRAANQEAHSIRSKAWFENNKERKHELDRLWRKKNKESIDAKRKQRHWDLKLEVWSHYGTVCTCCGESVKEFLTIDHINGGGGKHRKELRASGSQHIYQWLKKNDYPEGYRVLCMNCNFAFGMYGFCPHKTE